MKCCVKGCNEEASFVFRSRKAVDLDKFKGDVYYYYCKIHMLELFGIVKEAKK